MNISNKLVIFKIDIYFLAISFTRTQKQIKPGSSKHIQCPDLDFEIQSPAEINQDSLEKKLILDLEQGKHKVSLKHLVIQKAKKCLKISKNIVKRHRSQLQGAPTSRTLDNLNIKRRAMNSNTLNKKRIHESTVNFKKENRELRG